MFGNMLIIYNTRMYVQTMLMPSGMLLTGPMLQQGLMPLIIKKCNQWYWKNVWVFRCYIVSLNGHNEILCIVHIILINFVIELLCFSIIIIPLNLVYSMTTKQSNCFASIILIKNLIKCNLQQWWMFFVKQGNQCYLTNLQCI